MFSKKEENFSVILSYHKNFTFSLNTHSNHFISHYNPNMKFLRISNLFKRHHKMPVIEVSTNQTIK